MKVFWKSQNINAQQVWIRRE